MRTNLKKLVFCTLALAGVLTFSCKKADTPSNNNNNNGNTNTSAPSIAVYQPAVDTSVGLSENFTVKLIAKAAGTTNVDSIVGIHGFGHNYRMIAHNLAHGSKVSYTQDTEVYDIFQLPLSATAGTVLTFTYTVYGKGNSNVVSRKITVVGPAPIYRIYTKVTIYDQTQSGRYPFLNTGIDPSKNLPYSEGDVTSDSALRRLVDMCAAKTAGQPDILFSPGYVNESISKSFADSNILNINNGWLPSQRNTTIFKRLALSMAVTTKNFPNYASVQTAYKNAKGSGMPKVQNPFSPGDNYAFLTADGRYGAFTVDAIGGGVQMDMALESR